MNFFNKQSMLLCDYKNVNSISTNYKKNYLQIDINVSFTFHEVVI